MKVKESIYVKIFKVFNYTFLTLLALLCLYPFWYVLMASLSDATLLMKNVGVLLKPTGFSWEAYEIVLAEKNLYTGFANTFFLLLVGIPLNMIITCLGGYFFSRRNVYFRRPLMLFCMFTMYVSGGTIPFYLTLRDLNLAGTIWGLIIPFMLSTYNMIIIRTAFEAIPDSLTEAARIDGAGHLTILFKIVLPLSKATIAVIAMYYGMNIWNNWFWASITMRKESQLPLQAVLRNMLIEDTNSVETDIVTLMTVKYATIIVSIIPVLFIYPFMQKFFTKGVMIGGVKE